jgi:hypothetical protein
MKRGKHETIIAKMNRWSFLFLVWFCAETTFVKNRDYYDAIESRYNEMITRKPALSKYKTTIYSHLEQVVGNNAINIKNKGGAFICERCKCIDNRLQKLMLHECY